MTAYNREQHIAESIRSVLKSTHSDFELIIVDDGSTDGTVAITKEFAQSDNRIRVYVNEHNLGDYPNRNKAASYAQGEYLKYVDSDDLLYTHGLQIMVEAMEQFPEAGWGICTLPPDKTRQFPFQLNPEEAYRYHYLGPRLFHRAPISSIIRRTVFEKEGGFKPIRMAGDYEMWHRLALFYPVVLMQEGLIWNRIHDAQEMSDYAKYQSVYREIREQYLADERNPLDAATISKVRKVIKRKAFKSKVKRFVSRFSR